jgi:pyrroline-5-carboxylate reductase
MNDIPIAILGGGNMGRALIGGLIARGAAPSSIGVGESDADKREQLTRECSVRAFADNRMAVTDARVIVLAVKPQDVAAALAPLSDVFAGGERVLLSVAAGVRVEALRHFGGSGAPIVRAMPNRPALVGAGVTGLFAPKDTPDAARDAAERVMRAVGEIVWVASENSLDVVTALSGSGPAYFFLLAELMCEAAVALGLEPTTAHTLAVRTLHGSGALAMASDGDLARLRREVTSPGGTTAAALAAYEAADLRAIVARALSAATERSRELSDPLSWTR